MVVNSILVEPENPLAKKVKGLFFWGGGVKGVPIGPQERPDLLLATTKLYFCLHWFHDAVSYRAFFWTKILTLLNIQVYQSGIYLEHEV